MNNNEGFARLWRRKPLLVFGFVAAVALTVVFGFKAAFHMHDYNKRFERPVVAWMTPGQVARTYDLKIEDVKRTLGVDPDRKDPRTIARIARDTGQSRIVLLQKLEALIDEEHPGSREQRDAPEENRT